MGRKEEDESKLKCPIQKQHGIVTFIIAWRQTPLPTFVFQVWEGFSIAKPSWATHPLQGSARLTALRLLCPRLPEEPLLERVRSS